MTLYDYKSFPEYAKKPLLALSDDPDDVWTVDEAMKGISIMGGTGSGKTTSSGKELAHKFLLEGWGGIVLCAKSDEADLWEEYCEDTGRVNDFIRFGKGNVHVSGPFEGREIVFNPIDYELKREGEGAGETQNITNIFMNIYRMGNRIAGEGDNKEERFWDVALKRCLNRIIEIIKLAREDLSYRNIVKVISTCKAFTQGQLATATNEALSVSSPEKFKKDDQYCMYCLIKAYFNIKDEPIDSENFISFEMSVDYFTKAFPDMGEKTQATISESFMGLAEPFLSGMLYRHFGGVTNIYPEQTYGYNRNDPKDKRKLVIVLDFGVKEFLDAGIIAQSVFKLMFQQAIERRSVGNYPMPVFLWCDEAQYFINPYDMIFLTTARSSRTSTVYLSQNISNYNAVLGSGKGGEAKVSSLMGNLSTKIFHANSDSSTNEYASKLIGEAPQNLYSASIQTDPYLDVAVSRSKEGSTQYLPQVQPREFTTLKSGGERNHREVEAIVLVSGREWSEGKNYIRVEFKQKFRKS